MLLLASTLLLSVFTLSVSLPEVDTSSQLNVGILIMPGLFVSEATIPYEMYKQVGAPNAMNTYFVGETMDPVTTYYGARLLPHYTFANAPAPDILVIPSGIGSHHSFLTAWYRGEEGSDGTTTGMTTNDQPVLEYAANPLLIDWVRTSSEAAQIVTSHCWGAFTLADAGVLDGKDVTTFPGYTDTLAENYPAIASVVDDKRYVIDGKVMTSNGGIAAYEACHAVIKHCFSAEVADAVSSYLSFSGANMDHSTLDDYLVSPEKVGEDPYTGNDMMNVAILLVGGSRVSAVADLDVFAHVSGGRMTPYFVGESMEAIESDFGATMYPHYTLANAPSPDVVVVPEIPFDFYEAAVVAWLQDSAGDAAHISAHGSGTFLLARAGLLNGKVATTSPSLAAQLGDDFLDVDVIDARIVKAGNIVTSVGGVATYEAANYIVGLIYGDWQSRNVASGLVYALDNYCVVVAMGDGASSGPSCSDPDSGGLDSGDASGSDETGSEENMINVGNTLVMSSLIFTCAVVLAFTPSHLDL